MKACWTVLREVQNVAFDPHEGGGVLASVSWNAEGLSVFASSGIAISDGMVRDMSPNSYEVLTP